MPPSQRRATTVATAGSVIETIRSVSKGTAESPLICGKVAAGALRPSVDTPVTGCGAVVDEDDEDGEPLDGTVVVGDTSRMDG